jgi:hypothetical protein
VVSLRPGWFQHTSLARHSQGLRDPFSEDDSAGISIDTLDAPDRLAAFFDIIGIATLLPSSRTVIHIHSGAQVDIVDLLHSLRMMYRPAKSARS